MGQGMAFGSVAAAGVSSSGSRAAVSPAATRDTLCPSAHERRAVAPADLEADIGRIVEVAHVLRDRERPYRRVDAMAHTDRDLILGLEQPRQIGVLVREHARAYIVLSDDVGLLAIAVFIAEDVGGHDLGPVVRRQDAAFGAH